MAGDEAAREKVDALNKRLVELYQQGKYVEALPFARDAVQLAEV